MSVPRTRLAESFAALRRDLIHAEGPQISTMRNYRFAILPYSPEDEFKLRRQVQTLVGELSASGWVVLTLSLQQLLLARVRSLGDDVVTRIVEMEKRTARRAPERGLNYLRTKLADHVEGPDGIAADVSQAICAFADAHPDKAERTLCIVGRAGALYPFFRTSSLLKHIDGRTRNVPVVLLYPGKRDGDAGLSFMDRIQADRDYRPRIY